MRESFISGRLWLLGGLIFCCGLLALLPASLLRVVWPQTFPVALLATGGTLWQGGLYWAQAQDVGELRWRVSPWPLALGRVRATLSSEGALRLQGEVEWRRSGWTVHELKGAVPATLLAPLLPGWNLPGAFKAEGVSLGRAGLKQGAWTAGAGSLYWAGGEMNYQLSGQAGRARLPASRLVLRQQGADLTLDLVQAADSAPLANLRLLADGSADIQVRQRLLSYSPDYHGVAQPPDAVVVNVHQAPAGG